MILKGKGSSNRMGSYPFFKKTFNSLYIHLIYIESISLSDILVIKSDSTSTWITASPSNVNSSSLACSFWEYPTRLNNDRNPTQYFNVPYKESLATKIRVQQMLYIVTASNA